MAHRAAHRHRELWSSTSGQFTGLYYGVFNMLLKLVRELNPEHVWLVSDPIHPDHKRCWRNDYLPDYKQRQKKRDEKEERQYQAIQDQFAELRDALLHTNVLWFEQARLEADDIIGHLAMKYPDSPLTVVSTDRDLFTLISPNFTIYYPGKPHRWLMGDNFEDQSRTFIKANKKLPEHEQFSLTTKQWAEFRWLDGDKSDMIPGLPSCGPKTALKIILDHGGYNNFCTYVAEKEKPTKKEQKLTTEAAQQQYALNAFLMRLNPPQGGDPFDMSNPLCRAGSADFEWLKQWMQGHDFSESGNSLMAKLQSSTLCRNLSSPYDKLTMY